MDPPQIPWRPLGQLLVEHGMLTARDLEAVLAEQKQSGRRLGEIVVERRLISWPTLTTLLAAQYGLELATESGFGTGLRTEIERRHDERRSGERRQGDRRQGERRQADRRHPNGGQRPVGRDGTAEVRPQPSERGPSPEQPGEERARLNGKLEFEVLRATHHAWLAELTQKFQEQHGYLAAAAAKIEEHEGTLADLRVANAALNEEIGRLRTQLEQPPKKQPPKKRPPN